MVALGESEVEVGARGRAGVLASARARDVRRELVLAFVVQVRVEVAGRHRGEAGRDEVGHRGVRDEGARVVILRPDEVVAWILVRIENHVDTLAEVEVERLDLHGLDVVATVDRDHGHVVARDGHHEVFCGVWGGLRRWLVDGG